MTTNNKDQGLGAGGIILLVVLAAGWAMYFLRPMLETMSKVLGNDHMDDVREKWNEVNAAFEKADARMIAKVLALRQVFKMEEK
jgi:hypothetical protein